MGGSRHGGGGCWDAYSAWMDIKKSYRIHLETRAQASVVVQYRMGLAAS